MEETQWDIKTIKRLKKKQLVQINLVMLLLFLLFGYFSQNGKSSLIIWGFCVIMWLTVVITFFTLKRRPIGTKTSRILQKFDKDRLGQKRWKRRKIIEFGIISVISVFVTVLVFSMDFNSAKFDFPLDAFPFIGAWVGTNIGEIVRISNL